MWNQGSSSMLQIMQKGNRIELLYWNKFWDRVRLLRVGGGANTMSEGRCAPPPSDVGKFWHFWTSFAQFGAHFWSIQAHIMIKGSLYNTMLL